MSFTRKVKFPLTDHVGVTGIIHSNLFESEYSRVGLREIADSNTKLLLHCDGTDGSSDFPDVTGKIVTTFGNAQIDTGISGPFGDKIGVGLFDGIGDYLTTPTSTDFSFGTGDFTVDFRVRFASVTGVRPIVGLGRGAAGGPPLIATAWRLYYNASELVFYRYDGSETVVSRTWTPSTNTWYHVAIARSGTTMKMFINGTQIGTDISSSVGYSSIDSDDLFIGLHRSGAGGGTYNYFSGHIDELRISKGIARWTANFTPPTAPYIAYPTNSPSPATTWTALKSGDVVDMSTAKAWMYKDGVVQAAGNTDITFKYAANGGGDSAAKTLTQLRAESDVTVTNESNSFKIYGLYASDSTYKSESETWIEINVISADAAAGGSYLLDGGLIR